MFYLILKKFNMMDAVIIPSAEVRRRSCGPMCGVSLGSRNVWGGGKWCGVTEPAEKASKVGWAGGGGGGGGKDLH